MKNVVLSIYIILVTSVFATAQPTNPPPDPDPVPITGIEYLLIGGGAYGMYKLSRKRKNKNNEA